VRSGWLVAVAEQQSVGRRNERLDGAGLAPELQKRIRVGTHVDVQRTGRVGHRGDDGSIWATRVSTVSVTAVV